MPSTIPNAINVDISPDFENFKEGDDLPAIMFNTGVVDIHGGANISGLVYGPSFIEIENKEGNLQYFNGSILGGGGVLLEGDSNGGDTIATTILFLLIIITKGYLRPTIETNSETIKLTIRVL